MCSYRIFTVYIVILPDIHIVAVALLKILFLNTSARNAECSLWNVEILSNLKSHGEPSCCGMHFHTNYITDETLIFHK